MIKNRISLKAKVANLAKKTNIPNKYLIQNYMFEALLKRISLSKYKEKFIIKGGLLLSSIFGVDLRSTMDLDTTIKGIPLTKENLEKIMKEIIKIKVDDNVNLKLENIKDIRLEDEYSGFSVNLSADFDGLKTSLLIDITTGDAITYSEIEYQYKTIFEDETISIMSYNFETIIAEKLESILYRNIDNTRMKDYYDLYMFVNLKWDEVNPKELKSALMNTVRRRKTEFYLLNARKYFELIKIDEELKKLWSRYSLNYEYAKNITFDDTVKAIDFIMSELSI